MTVHPHRRIVRHPAGSDIDHHHAGFHHVGRDHRAEELAEGDVDGPVEHHLRRLGLAAPTDLELLPRLPEPAAELIRASEELFERVRRLDEGSFGDAAEGSPARSLLSRLERSL
mgnify:CR=1 FL=1